MRVPAGSSPRHPLERSVLPSGGAWLRVLLALTCSAAMVTVWVPATNVALGWLELIAMVVLVVWAVIRPGSAAAMVLISGIFAVRIFHGHAVLDAQLIVLVLLVSVIHYVAALAAVIPLRSSTAWVSLLPTGLRCAGAVLITVAVLVVTGISGLAPFQG